jgi:hypothetical protein
VDLQDLIGHISNETTSAMKALKILRQIENQPEATPKQLAAQQRRLEAIVGSWPSPSGLRAAVQEWLADHVAAAEKDSKRRATEFGAALDDALVGSGLRVSGQYPDLHVGIFTIEVRVPQGEAVYWYGPKVERLSAGPLVAADAARRLREFRDSLGSSLTAPEYVKLLRLAYDRVRGSSREAAVSLKSLHPEVAFSVQDPRFRSNPRRETFSNYTRADFSYDLSRIRGEPHAPRLIVATRANTRHAADSLWVPEADRAGTHYSHLQFSEE